MINDSQLELISTWKSTIENVGGKQPPTVYGTAMAADSSRVFYTQGLPYSNWCASIQRSILPNTGKLQLSFSAKFDYLTGLFSQAREFDTRLSLAALNYNFSSQFNDVTGRFQISGPTQGWVDTGFVPGKLSTDVWHDIVYAYQFDLLKEVYSFVSVTLNGSKFMIPASLQNLKPTKLGWTDGVVLQVQQDLGAQGGASSENLRNVVYLWA